MREGRNDLQRKKFTILINYLEMEWFKKVSYYMNTKVGNVNNPIEVK